MRRGSVPLLRQDIVVIHVRFRKKVTNTLMRRPTTTPPPTSPTTMLVLPMMMIPMLTLRLTLTLTLTLMPLSDQVNLLVWACQMSWATPMVPSSAPCATAICKSLGSRAALALTSANLSGGTSPLRVEDFKEVAKLESPNLMQ